MRPHSSEPGRLDPTLENLSEAFGFPVPPSLAGLVRAACRLQPEDPARAFEALGLVLGGPLVPFVGGEDTPLRGVETPPELFPFALDGRGAHWGLVVDDPQDGLAERPLARLDPQGSEGCALVASTLPQGVTWLVETALKGHPSEQDQLKVETLLAALAEVLPLPERATPDEIAREALQARLDHLTYRTDDLLGVVVPEEPAPLELISVESRRFLIGSRDRERVHAAGRRALRLGAPGAAVALGRDVLWQLGNRPEWHRVALETMDEAYHTLKRPLLAQVVRQEWARFHRKGRGE